MRRKFVTLATGLIAIGYALCLQSGVGHAQVGSPVEAILNLNEFQENAPEYFPEGAFKKPNGSPDEHFGDAFAKYLGSIGEPALFKSLHDSQAQAYRLLRISFPVAITWVLRLEIENQDHATVFVSETRFNSSDLLFKKEASVPSPVVNGFLECISQSDFWKLPTREQTEPQVTDGTYWILEGVRGGDYHVVYRRAPELHPGRFTDIGRYLAKDIAHLDDSMIRIPIGDRLEPEKRAAHE